MYINFMDMLRKIQTEIYPNVFKWNQETEVNKNETEQLKNDTQDLKDATHEERMIAEAKALTSDSFANNDGDAVNVYSYDPASDSIVSTTAGIDKKSAKYWANLSRDTYAEQKYEAIAAELTAASFATQAPNEPVKIYTSNGDGTFLERELEYTFSALHYALDTEKLTGHKRWVESIVAADGQQVVGFQKNVGHGDVYVNGIRKAEGFDYTVLLKDVTFTNVLSAGDIVTLSAMEAVTGSEFKSLAEQAAYDAERSEKDMWKAEAARKTAESFASQPYGEHVIIYTSNGDGTFSGTETNIYSTLHWTEKLGYKFNNIVVVDTYHDLELLNVNEASTVYVRGRLEPNDGNGGFFVYKDNLSSINNGGTIINGYERSFTGYVNLDWFGVVGDGQTDDTQAIKNILLGSNEVYFPKGMYAISETIDMSNKRIKSDNAIFVSFIDEGVAINLTGIDTTVYGELKVLWPSQDKAKDRISFLISDAEKSEFNLSSENHTIGLKLDTQSGSVKFNTINIHEFKNGVIGVIAIAPSGANTVSQNTVNINSMLTGVVADQSSLYSDIAGFVVIAGENNASNEVYANSMIAVGNSDTDFLLFNIEGNETKLYIDKTQLSKNNKIKAKVSGNNVLLSLLNNDELNVFLDDSNSNLQTDIDISAADNIKIIGSNSIIDKDSASFEYIKNDTKPMFELSNTSGRAIDIKTTSVEHNAVRINNKDTGDEAYIADKYINFINNNLSSTLSYNYLKIMDGIDDGITMTNSSFSMSSGLDSMVADSGSFGIFGNGNNVRITKEYIVVEEPSANIKSTITKNSVKIDDQSNSSIYYTNQNYGKYESGNYKNELNATSINITSTVSGDTQLNINRDFTEYSDGNMTSKYTNSYFRISENGTSIYSELGAGSLHFENGSVINTVDSSGVFLFSGSDTAEIMHDHIEFDFGTEKSIYRDHINLSSTADQYSTNYNRKSLQLFSPDAEVALSTVIQNELVVSDQSLSALELTHSNDGAALLVNVTNENSSAVEVGLSGSTVTKITAGKRWTINNKSVVWTEGSAPLNTGSEANGDIVLMKTYSVNDPIGYVYVDSISFTYDAVSGSSDLVNIAGIESLLIGDIVSGSSVPVGSKITSIDIANNKVTINNDASGDESGSAGSSSGWRPFGNVGAVDLSIYAKTTDLNDYAKTTDLNDYAKTTDLNDYAKTTDLNDYAKKDEANTFTAPQRSAITEMADDTVNFDFRVTNNYKVTLTTDSDIGVVADGTSACIGQSGVIRVDNAEHITGWDAKFVWKDEPLDLNGTERFPYFIEDENTIVMGRIN